MAPRPKAYRRLPGRPWLAFVWIHSLWLGSDHLLRVASNRFTEEYRRFYYRDIHAIILNKTSRRAVINLFAGAVLALFGMLWLGSRPGRGWFSGSIALIATTVVLVNWFLGPTCECRVTTAVQTERLPSLRRLRSAREAVRRVQSRIEQAQGRLSQQDLAGGTTSGSATPETGSTREG